ncbi:hypothetical protein BDR04DRAFT_1235567 [Suillus decipiens]|nr:hypothetical protein BDR04DRAFT_1235567 [Suillus decipiens]
MLAPYLLDTTVVPSADTPGIHSLQWASPIFKSCATTHTTATINKIPLMTPSERLLFKAIEDTTREICRVTTNMWAIGAMSGFDTLFPMELNEESNVALEIMVKWRQDIQKLMSWLDWSIWIKCQPACGPEEICYLPTWPLHGRSKAYPRPPREPRNATDASAEVNDLADRCCEPPLTIQDAFVPFETPMEEWRKPQPKCIRRFAPYGF